LSNRTPPESPGDSTVAQCRTTQKRENAVGNGDGPTMPAKSRRPQTRLTSPCPAPPPHSFPLFPLHSPAPPPGPATCPGTAAGQGGCQAPPRRPRP